MGLSKQTPDSVCGGTALLFCISLLHEHYIEHNDDEGYRKKKVNYSHQGADGNARMCDKSPASWNLCVPINQGYIVVACSLRVHYTLHIMFFKIFD